MRRTLASLLLALALGCTREAPAPAAPKKSAPAETRRDGGRVVLRLEAEPASLNYVLHTTEDERQVLSFLHDPLIAFDRDMSPMAGTAARWEILDGGLTYILHLDPRATFSDGKPVRASDVVFTLHKILDEESQQYGAVYGLLDRAKTAAVDERTVRVAFREARAGQLLAFNIGVLPEHVFGKGDFKKNRATIGNGPYVVRQWTRGRGILLERRADYWREKPAIESVFFRPIAENAVAWKALQRGDVDVTRVDNDIWARVNDDQKISGRIAFHNVYRLGYNCIIWNLTDPILSDARVRRALAMSFDRDAVIEKIYHGQARPVSGPFTLDEEANNRAIVPIEYNPTAAGALLQSAGWRDSDGDGVLDRGGRKFELTLHVLSGNDTSREQSQVLQEALRALGVQLQLRLVDDAAFYGDVLGRNYQAAYIAWVNEPDPDPYGLFHSSQIGEGMNVVSYKSEEADQLMEEARTELDHERRMDLFHQLHEVLARDQPYLWIVQVAEKWAVNKRVQDVQVARGLGIYHWYPGPRAWWIAK
ncbi:MAG TPA: ABC transporter substrate-binding protein [Thermoanaerobaculia bacterium]|jgi:peptide/nickel transport system substrate-binding protein